MPQKKDQPSSNTLPLSPLSKKSWSISKKARRFRYISGITLISIYVLIVVGVSVRASGAGMGCPDWPQCFGMLIPPTSVEQLPINYQQLYADRGYENTEFNPVKTWTEFGNRMTSVVVGFLMLLCTGYAFIYLHKNRVLLVLLASMLGITATQAWLGAIVVASHLHPLIVSSHMLLALLVVLCIHAIYECSAPPRRIATTRHLPWLVACAGVLMIQIALGLQVRENLDVLAVIAADFPRYTWIAQLDGSFSAHMIWSLVILNLFAYTQFRLWRDRLFVRHARVWFWAWVIGLVGNLASGSVMWLFGLPPVVQSLHLLFASIQFGALWHLLLLDLRSHSPHARTIIATA